VGRTQSVGFQGRTGRSRPRHRVTLTVFSSKAMLFLLRGRMQKNHSRARMAIRPTTPPTTPPTIAPVSTISSVRQVVRLDSLDPPPLLLPLLPAPALPLLIADDAVRVEPLSVIVW